MVLLYMVTWIPSIYPLYVSIYTIHGSYGYIYILHYIKYISGWWFGSFFIFPYIGNSNPN